MKNLIVIFVLLLSSQLNAQAFGIGGSAPTPGVFHPPGSSAGGQYIAPGDSAGPNTGGDGTTTGSDSIQSVYTSRRTNGSRVSTVPATSSVGTRGSSYVRTINFTPDDWKIWWELNKFEFINLSDKDFGTDQGRYESQEDKELRMVAMRKFIRENVVPTCRELLISKDPSVRSSAVVTLGKLRDAESMRKIMGMMKDPHVEVRRAAMLALGVMNYPYGDYVLMNVADDTEVGRNLLEEDEISVDQRGTSLLVGSLRHKTKSDNIAGKLILNLLETHENLSTEMLMVVCEAAGIYEDREHFHPLRDIATNEEYPTRVRSAAITALGRLGERAIAPDLVYIMRSDELEPKRAATLALGTIAYSTDIKIIDQLQYVMEKDSDAPTRHFAAISLGRIGGSRAKDVLHYGLKHGSDDMLPWIALGIGINTRVRADLTASNALLSALAYVDNPDTRGAIIIAIGLSKAPSAVPLLTTHLEEGNEFEAACAAMALGLTEDPSAKEPLRNALKSLTSPYVIRQAAFACGILGATEAIPQLVEIIRTTPNPFVASYAAIGIAFMGEEEAVGPLLSLVDVADPCGVRTAWAIAAVGQLFDTDRRPALTHLASNSNYFTQTDTVDNLLILGF